MRRRPPRSTLCPYTTLFRSAYRLGSLTHADPAIRRRAVEHHAQCVEVMRQTGSTDLKIWLPDGTNYPGQDDLRARQDRLSDSLQQVYAMLDPDKIGRASCRERV